MPFLDSLSEFSTQLNALLEALEKQFAEEYSGDYSSENVNGFLVHHKNNVYNQINALKALVFAAYNEPNNGTETDEIIHNFWIQLLDNMLALVDDKVEEI